MSSCSDLERMGDHMAGIAKAVLQLKENQLAPNRTVIHQMGKLSHNMSRFIGCLSFVPRLKSY